MNSAHALSRLTRHTLAFGLISLLFVQPALALGATLPDGPAKTTDLPEAPYPESEGLTIEILDGEGALNNIRQRTAREPIVQVEDKNHKPVAGAAVLFSINTGSGGAGANVGGLSSFTVRTGIDGKAQLKGLQPNNISGEFTITVTASVGSLVATAVIHQKNSTFTGESNTTNSSSSQPSGAQTATNIGGQVLQHGHNFLVIGSIVGAAAAAGLVAGLVVATKTSGARITAGTGTVTAP